MTASFSLPLPPIGDSAGACARLLREAIVPGLTDGSLNVLCSGTAGSLPVVRWGRTPPRAMAPRRAHAYYEVCWVVGGRCVLELEGHTLALDRRHACIVRPGEPHQLRATPDLAPFRALWWGLSQRGVRLSQGVFPRRNEHWRNVLVRDPSLVALVESAVHELEMGRPYHDLFIRAAFLKAVAQVLRALAEVADGSSSTGASRPLAGERRASNWYLQRLIQYVEAHHEADLSLERLAAVVGLTPCYVTTLFRRHTVRTAMAYVAEARYDEARSLLRTTVAPVAEVARRAGYADPYYFSRVFKAREGCTPRQYRALFRSGGATVAP